VSEKVRLMAQGCRAFPLQHTATLEVPMSLKQKSAITRCSVSGKEGEPELVRGKIWLLSPHSDAGGGGRTYEKRDLVTAWLLLEVLGVPVAV